jgi:hypothetical protein
MTGGYTVDMPNKELDGDREESVVPSAAYTPTNRMPWWKELLAVYLPAMLGFLVINLTNGTLLALLLKHHMIYGSDPSAAVNAERTIRYFIIPLKSFCFFLCTSLLIYPLGRWLYARLRTTLTRGSVVRSAISLCCGLALMATLAPEGFGRSYARISVDAFNQDPGQLSRRMLMPGLANIYHLNGVLFTVFNLLVVAITILTLRFYIQRKGIRLSIFEEVSLLTTGVMASCFLLPGQPECLVLLLALVALLTFEEDGFFSWKQLGAFSLALMTHEACAAVMFVPMFAFLFGRRSWLPCATILALYVTALGANFGFHFAAPIQMQTTIENGKAPADYFRSEPYRVAIGAFCSFKFLWVLLGVGLYSLIKKNLRLAGYILASFLLAIATTYTAIDYSRMIGFATLPIVLCFIEAKGHMPRKVFYIVVLLNLLTPSIVYAASSIGIYRGLYRSVYGPLIERHRGQYL